MKRRIIKTALFTSALLLSASLCLAVENKPGAAAETKAVSGAKTTETITKKTSAKTKSAKAAAKVKLVDINSASKTELKTLPGISDKEADKIIAGRPYLSKAKLVAQNVLSRDIYEGLKKLVIAKQNQATAAKLDELQKARKTK